MSNFGAIDHLKAEIETVTDIVQQLAHGDLVDALKAYSEIRDFHETLSAAQKELAAQYRKATQEILPDMFADHGVTSATVNSYRYSMIVKPRAAVRAGHKEEAFDWLRQHDYEDIITETVNANTLSALAKDLAEQGFELPAYDEDLNPDGVFNIYDQKTISRTKVRV
jgi:hypothetical protein